MRRFKGTGIVGGLAIFVGLSTGGVLPPAVPVQAQEVAPGAGPAPMSASLRVAVARSLARDDAGALAPLASDAWVQQAKLTAQDGSFADFFGISAALDGDTALVGALGADVGGNQFQGVVYVFTRIGGVWSEQAKLTAADGAAGDQFGTSVALDGDTALVGAEGVAVNGNVSQGKAYVFTRSGGVWTEQQQLTAGDGAALNAFGTSVALDGDTAVVGALGAQVGGNESQGAIYVFTRTGGAWNEQAKLTAADGASGDQFGISVALDGDTTLVGANFADVGGKENQGVAYVFTRSGGLWSEHQRLAAADGADGDNFGISIALDGDAALMGAWAADVGGNDFQGAVYVFTRSGGLWSEDQKLSATDGAGGDEFGISVALDGDTALAGARGAVVGPNVNQGAAYVFTRSGGVWSEDQKLTTADGAGGNNFGNSVALGGDTALVGAYLTTVGGNGSQGAAYVYTLAVPALGFEPSALDFGEAEVGSTSDAMTATLQNAGTAAATGLTLTAPGNGFTVETNTCADTLAAGDSCEVSVTFTPAGTGPASGTLTIASTEGATAALALSGTGVQVRLPRLMFTPASLDFGDVDVNTASEPKTATLRNDGDADADGVTFRPIEGGFTADTSDCGSSLAAGESCDVSVTFAPTRVGPATASLVVDGGATGSDQVAATLDLTGAGTEIPTFRYDFAEGATGYFTTTLGLFNPDRTATANVEVRLLPEGRAPIVLPITLAPFGRDTVDVNAAVNAATGVAAVVTADRPIAPLRQMSWDASGFGSTLESGAPGPSTTHYFAEGATAIWDLFYLLANDNDAEAQVTIEYLRDQGEPITQRVTVPAHSRQTVWVNAVPGMANTQGGAIITADVPIAAERSMYLSAGGWPAGASSRGAHNPADTWYFAEGSTRFFDHFLLLMNPSTETAATVDVRYQLADGQTITTRHVVPPQARRTILVEAEDPALADQLMAAMTVSASQPVVAERAFWWGPTAASWYESSASVGSVEPGTVWAIGEAWSGGPAAEDAYVLLANTAAEAGAVRVTLVYDDGSSDAREVAMAGQGRVTLLLSALFPASDGRRFSVLVESLGGDTAVPIVVDVSRYQSTDGRFGNAGGSTTATRIR